MLINGSFIAVALNVHGLSAALSRGSSGASSFADLAGSGKDYQLGVSIVLGASMLSGLSSALTQRALVGHKPRHPLFFSSELAVYGIVFLLINALCSKEGAKIFHGNFFHGWTPYTIIPVITNVKKDALSSYSGGTQLFSLGMRRTDRRLCDQVRGRSAQGLRSYRWHYSHGLCSMGLRGENTWSEHLGGRATCLNIHLPSLKFPCPEAALETKAECGDCCSATKKARG